MRSPSAKVLVNTCNVFNSTPVTASDADGGPQFPYPSTPTYANVPCTIQGRAMEVVGEQRRITQVTGFVIIFGQYVVVTPRDMITFVDNNGTLRTTFVESIEDMAGRGAAFKVYASERL